MKRLYIFDTYLYSLRCGLGAYLKNLAAVVSQWEGWNVCFIMFKTNVKKCTIYTCKGIDYILLPQEQVGNLFPNPPLRQDLLPLIETDEECIFMYNYLPYNQLVQTMKEGIPTAKHISAIHDFCWTAPLFGDVHKLKRLITQTESSSFENMKITVPFKAEKMQFQLSDKVICLSEETQKVLLRVYGLDVQKISLIPNSIATKGKKMLSQTRLAYRHKYGIADHEVIMLTVGRISQAKGHFALLQTFKRILKVKPCCRWIIAGELTNAPDFLEQAGEAVTRITLTGHVDKKLLSQWYQMADIGVLPSYTEQCSYAGLEMMAHGLPVVASDGFGVRCMFQNEVNAYVARIGSRKSSKTFERNLTDCVLRLIDNEEGKERLRQNGYRILRERYAPAEMEKRYKALFENL